jgi:threonine aldolase
MDVIDLRSDTVTHPTPQMREAIATAEVGDDIYGEDPTVNQLERDAAQLLGKEAGLLVTSGHQGNLIAVLTHCARGTEVILGDKAHIFKYEAGSISALGGVHPHTLPVLEDGTISLDAIQKAIRADDYHFPPTALICLENTQGTVGAVPITKAYTDQVGKIAHDNGLKLHIDGARIFNASTALNIPVHELVESADSITFCLSKGLCAPVGSVLVGSADFIKQARRVRKMLGGGMRQAGIIAAAGLIGIHEMSKRLHIDHENAQFIAQGLANHTNFVFFDLAPDARLSPSDFMQKLADEYNIRLSLYPGYTHSFRIVTHYWISRDNAQQTIDAIRQLLT